MAALPPHPAWRAIARWSDRFDPRALPGGVRGLLAPSPEGSLPAPLVALLEEARREPPCPPPTLVLGEPGYPASLLDLPRPPPVLWCRGSTALLEAPGLAVVGTRCCTERGRGLARRLGQAVAMRGGVLVSGGARGIDEAAHRGALDVGGRTVMVLGAGIGAAGRGGRARLEAAVVEAGGLVLSEMPPGEPPLRWTFPRRNRIIAALGRATVVVEAGLRSGAAITAARAAEIGREVLAVPGWIDDPASRGCLRLLDQGATLLLDLDRALARLGPTGAPAERLVRALGRPMHPERLALAAGLPADECARWLAMLEVTGVVLRCPDGRVRRAGA